MRGPWWLYAVATSALGCGILVLLLGVAVKLGAANAPDGCQPQDTVMGIVAARDLAVGTPISEEDLYAVEIPPKWLPWGVFLSPEQVVGITPTQPILANEFIRAERFDAVTQARYRLQYPR